MMNDKQMLLSLNEKRLEGKYCDFKISCQGQIFPAHQFVLDERSEYFRTMLSSSMREANSGTCEIDAEPFAIRACLNYIYTGNLPLKDSEAIGILKLCHMWMLEDGIELCEEYLKTNLSSKDCVSLALFASAYDLDRLLKACVEYIVRHCCEVEDIGDLYSEHIEIIINQSEMKHELFKNAWNVLQSWIRSSSQNEERACVLLKKLPMEFFSIEQISDTILQCSHVMKCKECEDTLVRKKLRQVKSDDINLQNCLKWKTLANKYNNEDVQATLNDFIAQHFSKVCVLDEFTSCISPNDIVYCTSRTDNSCSQQSFEAILDWLRFNDERASAFPSLFMTPSSESLVSNFQRTLYQISTAPNHRFNIIPSEIPEICRVTSHKCVVKDHVDDDSFTWRLTDHDSISLKGICHEYGAKTMEEKLDEALIKEFGLISRSVYFKDLGFEDLNNYFNNAELYEFNYCSTIWKALKKWTEFDKPNRMKDFEKLFKTLKLHKFPSKFILDTVFEDDWVNQSTSSALRLVKLLFEMMLDKQVSTGKPTRDRKEDELLKKLVLGRSTAGRTVLGLFDNAS